jgi:hypothetical protein
MDCFLRNSTVWVSTHKSAEIGEGRHLGIQELAGDASATSENQSASLGACQQHILSEIGIIKFDCWPRIGPTIRGRSAPEVSEIPGHWDKMCRRHGA